LVIAVDLWDDGDDSGNGERSICGEVGVVGDAVDGAGDEGGEVI
jgi:hypothetical protein